MGRTLLALAAGYFAMALPVVLLFALAFGGAEPGTLPSGRFLALSVAVGFASAALGGFVAGRVAGRLEVQHAFLLALVGALLGVVASLLDTDAARPLWYVAANLAVLVAGAPLGGLVAARSGERRRAAVEPGPPRH